MCVYAQPKGAPTTGVKGDAKVTPNWTPIAQDVMAVDIHGDTVNTAAIRAAGKALLVDYSATWCSWCWVLHTNGILEAIHHQLGDRVEVVWVEADPGTNNPAELTGQGGRTQGDWTNGGTVPYPIVDDPSFTELIGGEDAISGFPTVVFVSPTGYWCSVYSEPWGFGPSDSTEAVASVANLLQSYPIPNTPPRISIEGPNTAVSGNSTTFRASIVSADEVTDIHWTFNGATPATANTANASVMWNTDGTYDVVLAVTNTTGTSYDTLTIQVISWHWDETMGYGLGRDDEAKEGFRIANTNTWAVMFPARFLEGRQYLKSVDFYAVGTQEYILNIYQGGTYAPGERVYNRIVAGEGVGWQRVNISGPVAVDPTKNLWVMLTAPSQNTYPMSVYEHDGTVYYCGDPNGCWAFYNNRWISMLDFGDEYACTWAIKVTTGDTPNVGIDMVEGTNATVYPNPTSGMVRIDVDGFEQVEVTDMIGRVVMASKESSLDISSLDNGVYIFRIYTASGIQMQKVNKRR